MGALGAPESGRMHRPGSLTVRENMLN